MKIIKKDKKIVVEDREKDDDTLFEITSKDNNFYEIFHKNANEMPYSEFSFKEDWRLKNAIYIKRKTATNILKNGYNKITIYNNNEDGYSVSEISRFINQYVYLLINVTKTEENIDYYKNVIPKNICELLIYLITMNIFTKTEGINNTEYNFEYKDMDMDRLYHIKKLIMKHIPDKYKNDESFISSLSVLCNDTFYNTRYNEPSILYNKRIKSVYLMVIFSLVKLNNKRFTYFLNNINDYYWYQVLTKPGQFPYNIKSHKKKIDDEYYYMKPKEFYEEFIECVEIIENTNIKVSDISENLPEKLKGKSFNELLPYYSARKEILNYGL